MLRLVSLCLAMSVGHAFADAHFTARLTKTEAELGKYFGYILTSDRSDPMLDTIDLGPLEEDFHVSELTGGVTHEDGLQKWRLRLYPRRTGQFKIPVIRFAGTSSDAVTVTVSEPLHHQQGDSYQIDFLSQNTKAYVNQGIAIEFSLLSSDPHLLVETSAPPREGGQLRLISPVVNADDRSGLVRYTLGWVFYPREAGRYTLELPPVELTSGGKNTHRFYLPKQVFEVEELPIYVPSSIPVGRFSIESDPVPRFVFTNTLETITLRMRTEGVLPALQPNLANLMLSQPDFRLYPAKMSRSEAFESGQSMALVELQVPFKAERSGLFQLETIEIRTFDPHTGRISLLQFEWPKILAVSPWLLGVMILPPLIALVLFLGSVARVLVKKMARFTALKSVKKSLLSAVYAEDIRKSIVFLIEAESGSVPISLRDWHHRVELDYDLLDRALYRGDSYTIESLREPYLGYLRKAHPFI